MIIPWEKLKNLPVETQSGERLGRMSGFDLSSDGQDIKTYRVKSRGIIKGLMNGELLISREQVVSINDERLIVPDALVTEKNALRSEVASRVTAESAPATQSRISSSQNLNNS
ncbi:MAG: PRC-barrel domain-containing protein [Patescibacteria group bacterium]|nr:PRC-barrel domain-containing protein [Patescibacteria group bacterium]